MEMDLISDPTGLFLDSVMYNELSINPNRDYKRGPVLELFKNSLQHIGTDITAVVSPVTHQCHHVTLAATNKYKVCALCEKPSHRALPFKQELPLRCK